MPVYEITSPDGRVIELEGDRPPSIETIKKAFAAIDSQQIQTEQTQQVTQTPQDESIIQKLLRLDRESAKKAEQRWRERGVADPDVQTIPEIAKGALNLASYLPVSAPLRLGKYAKGAYELGVPALLGAGARYIGEREKGQYAEDAAGTAAKQAATEIATGAALTRALKLGKAGLKKLSEGIPDDLYKKAKQFSQDKSKTITERVKEIKKLGTEAIEANKKIDANLQKMAEKATIENKNAAGKIAGTINKLSKKFFAKSGATKLADQIKGIPDTTMDALIENQHNKLIQNAEPIIQDGAVKRNREAEALLTDFRRRFMTKKTTSKTKLEPSKKDPSILIPKKEKIIEYSPIKSRVTFFKEMRLISDKSTFGEGKKAVGQSYAKIYKNFNDFLKENSKQYKDHKELGQLLVNFSKYKPDIAEGYDANKIKKALKEALETFDKTPDPDSVRRLDDFVKQAKKYRYKTEVDLEKYNKNLEMMQFEKAGTKGLTKQQIESLKPEIRDNYLKNQELSQLTKEPLFTGTGKAQQVTTDPSKMGRIKELLPEELVENLEIEEAKRAYDELTRGLTPSGEIPYVSPFVGKYFLASQIARKGLSSPAIQGLAKEFIEGDTKISPEVVKAGAKLGARALPRQFYGTYDQRIDTVRDPITGRAKFIKRDPFAIKRKESGQLTPQTTQQIKEERRIK